MVGQHLFLNIIPNNFTARTEQKVWCDWGILLCYFPQHLSAIDIPMRGSIANQRYLGYYQELFDIEVEQPVPTWSAIA